jgi:toxin HigB-1
MIVSFADRRTADLFHGRVNNRTRRLPADILSAALRKLDMLHAARQLDDLRSPPSNHLESLRRDLKGFYSIRVNDQWRIIFQWEMGEARQVRIIDYH